MMGLQAAHRLGPCENRCPFHAPGRGTSSGNLTDGGSEPAAPPQLIVVPTWTEEVKRFVPMK
jgi:hypothetical protein